MQSLLSYFEHYVKLDIAEIWFQNTTFNLTSCDLRKEVL